MDEADGAGGAEVKNQTHVPLLSSTPGALGGGLGRDGRARKLLLSLLKALHPPWLGTACSLDLWIHVFSSILKNYLFLLSVLSFRNSDKMSHPYLLSSLPYLPHPYLDPGNFFGYKPSFTIFSLTLSNLLCDTLVFI